MIEQLDLFGDTAPELPAQRIRARRSTPAPAEHAGRCDICHRKLTDAESVAIGRGPTCRTKHGMPDTDTDREFDALVRSFHTETAQRGDPTAHTRT